MKISEVFTPRHHSVNLKTYVPRSALETSLARSIQGSLHTILHGESGNGKSWLYRRVFAQYGFQHKIANCANASRLGSLVNEIVNALRTKSSAVGGQISDVSLAANDDPLYKAFSTYRRNIGSGDGIIVLENLEAIFGEPKLMNELANILLLLDDPLYGELRIKFLIVGVPNGILDYFARTKNVESVSNRLEELGKVSGLDFPMVKTLVVKGFNESLKYGLSDDHVHEISMHIHHVTLGVAQRVQEFCERLAYKLEDARKIYSDDRLREAESEWLAMGLRQAYVVVESHLNSKQTTIARRNQVIYCIGRMTGHQLDPVAITEKVRSAFPATAKESNMGVAGILSELASSDQPLLTRNPKTKDFRIVDPRYKMCIRAMLFINQSTSAVEKRMFRI